MKKLVLALSLFAFVGTTAVVANNYINKENTELSKKKKKKKKKSCCSTESKASCGSAAVEKKSCGSDTKKEQ
ncbi:MAG: hypothetical protein SFU27_09400 [Thermonemataceae bacterium]|nr:hypothetical protein [Thermonemataceae bacterium]